MRRAIVLIIAMGWALTALVLPSHTWGFEPPCRDKRDATLEVPDISVWRRRIAVLIPRLYARANWEPNRGRHRPHGSTRTELGVGTWRHTFEHGRYWQIGITWRPAALVEAWTSREEPALEHTTLEHRALERLCRRFREISSPRVTGTALERLERELARRQLEAIDHLE